MIVKARQLAGFDARYVPGLGLPRPADREPDREDARPRPAARRGAGQEPRLRHRADRAADGRLQAPGRARRLGPPLPHDGLRQRGRRDPRAQAPDRARLRLPRPASRCTGASTAAARWPSSRSSTPTRSRTTVDVAFLARRARQAGRGLRPAGADEGRLRGDLDHHAVDAAGQPGAEPEPRARLRAGGHRARPAAAGRGAGRDAAWRATAWRARCSPRRKGEQARRPELPPPAGACRTRATTACRRSTWPTTPPPTTAPASCTRRRPTAWTTSTPASRMAWRTTTS